MINPLQETLQRLTNDVTEYMKKEISIMREVLANMHQEEVALIMLDKNSLHKTLQDRFPMVETLSWLRNARMVATEAIRTLYIPSKTKETSTNNMAYMMELQGCEIDYLSEQMLALIKSMNTQNCKNDTLTKKYELYTNYPARLTHLMPWQPAEGKIIKSKASIATYPIQEP